MVREESLVEIIGREKPASLGMPISHESAEKHVSGSALYVDDINAPEGMLYGYVGLSDVARGIIKKIDLTHVRSAEGVVDVVVLTDVPGETDIGPVYPGDPIMVNLGDEVEFHGQVIFAVAATSQLLARKAARMGIVEYEEKTPSISIQSGLANKEFVMPSHEQVSGAPEQAIKNAERRLSGELITGGQEQMYLEGQVSLCVPSEDGGMSVYTSSQNPAEGQKLVAKVLGVPMNKVTVEVRRMGGAFGGKETNANHWACIAALLANKTKQPVKIRLARADDMRVTGKRHHFLSRYQVGFDSKGVIGGLDLELSAGCGMSPDLSNSIVDRAMFHADNAYYLGNARVVGHRVKTNTVSNTAFRGFGGPQGMAAIENIIDEIARDVGRDPLDVRKDNFYSAKGGRDTTHYGQKIKHHQIADIVDRLETNSDYRQRRRDIETFNSSNPILKRGIALTPVKFGIAFTVTHLNQAGALINIYTDGSIHLAHGGTEMGQGLLTKVAQIVAGVFQVSLERIYCSATLTDKVPNASPTAASSGTDLNGMAAKIAAEKIKNRLVEFLCERFEVASHEISFRDNKARIGDTILEFNEVISLAYHARVSLSAAGFYKTPLVYYDRDKGRGRPFLYFANGAAVSEVIIDCLTGESRLLRVDICHDVGNSINPAIDIGQIEGGFVQGMGWVTSEELVWDQSGRLLTSGPATYKIPAIGDAPPIFNVELLPESPNKEATVFRSKAVGEPPLMLAISVWSAIKDAISSISEYASSPKLDTPATPERILKACMAMRNNRVTEQEKSV